MSFWQTIQSKTPLIAAISGALCALCVFLYIQNVNGEAEAVRADALARYGGEQLEVCVASRDLSVGTTISETDIQVKLWLVDLLPADAVRSSSDVIGRQVTSPILQGEVMSLKRFTEQAFSIEVPEGMSAVCVPAKTVQAVGGVLSPGMKVDVYATGDTTTTRIGQEMLILATSTNASSATSDSSVSWVTLAVPPQSVQEFVIAAQESKLYFVLPNKTTSATSDETGESQSSGASGGYGVSGSNSASESGNANSSKSSGSADESNSAGSSSSTNSSHSSSSNSKDSSSDSQGINESIKQLIAN